MVQVNALYQPFDSLHLLQHVMEVDKTRAVRTVGEVHFDTRGSEFSETSWKPFIIPQDLEFPSVHVAQGVRLLRREPAL